MKKEETKNKTTKKDTTTKEKNNKKKNENKKEFIEAKVEQELVVEEENKIKEEKTVTKKQTTLKKSDLFLILGLVVVVILGFLVMKDKNAGPSYELPLTLSGEAGLQQLTYAQYKEKIDNNDQFVVILERATCGHCITYIPIAEQFASDNNVPMYYVDTDTFSQKDWEGFEKSISFLKKANGNWGTPTTVVQAGSTTVDYIEGTTTAEELLNLYHEYFDMGE